MRCFARKHQSACSSSPARRAFFHPILVMPITPSGSKININTAGTKQLTQLPGIAKNVVYRIVNHRSRHGFFTHWTELLEVKEFPADALDRIKQRATLE